MPHVLLVISAPTQQEFEGEFIQKKEQEHLCIEAMLQYLGPHLFIYLFVCLFVYLLICCALFLLEAQRLTAMRVLSESVSLTLNTQYTLREAC